MFADDTKLYSCVNDDRSSEVLQRDLDSLVSWSESWQLPFNVSKCKVMHLGKNTSDRTYSLTKDGNISHISSVMEEKDLGVTFDEKLKFSQQVGKVVATANRKLGMIRRTFSSFDRDALLHLYKTLIRPVLEYSSCVWHPLLKKDIEKLEKVQRRATKLVRSLRNLDYPSRLRSLKLPTLAYRRHRSDMLQVFRLVTGIDDFDPSQFFSMAKTKRTRGHGFKMEKKRARTKLRQGVFSQRVVTHWNNLPEDVVMSPSINTFKSRLEKVWKRSLNMYDPNENFLCPCSTQALQRQVNFRYQLPDAEGQISLV